MRHLPAILFLIAAHAAGAAATAAAATVDPYSGNTLEVPAGWNASPEATSTGNPFVRLTRQNDPATTCIVRFSPASAYGGRSQDELNAMVSGPDWQTPMMKYLNDTFAAQGFSLLSRETTDTNGITSYVVVGALRAKEGGTDADPTRLWWVAQARPAGLTTTSCSTDADNFPARVVEFWAILRGMTLR